MASILVNKKDAAACSRLVTVNANALLVDVANHHSETRDDGRHHHKNEHRSAMMTRIVTSC